MKKMGMVFVQSLRLEACIGCSDEERKCEQPLLIDICCEVDMAPAIGSDRRSDCVDYGKVREIALACAKPIYHLLETLAANIVDQCLELEHVQFVSVTIKKPEIFSDCMVGITYARKKEA